MAISPDAPRPATVRLALALVAGPGAAVRAAAGADDETAGPGWARLVVTVREGRPAETRRP